MAVDLRSVYTELLGAQVDERRRVLASREGPVAAWLESIAPLRRRERHPATRSGRRRPDRALVHALTQLYALGRVRDQLLEPGHLDLYHGFMAGIGLVPFEHDDAFSPFHHELVEVVADESQGQVTVERVLWGGFMFGDLLIGRAGVRVRAPAALLDPDVAVRSRLFFTFRRRARPTNDRSHGWGSNSQWATMFDRFYQDEGGLHFNWDGAVDLGAEPPARDGPAGPSPDAERPLERRRELLVNRCFVRAPLPDDEPDWYPYDTRLSLRHGAWPIDRAAVVPGP
jgi:hypothetical protein